MLEIRNIVKQYADHRALDDVSLYVPEGKIFGLLGPNGAGKTSLIRIINQITAPDSGEILFNNQPLSSQHISAIGYLPEERGLYKKMKVGEQMVYLAQLKGLSRQDANKRLNYWFEKLEIGSWWNKRIEDLSKGMQQKVQFVATVLHEPQLIILDEPFSGFDPVNAQVIQDEILELNEKGATIIYSTHRMETVEELCDNIALINKSKKVLDGSVKEIKKQYNSQTYLIDYQGPLLSDDLLNNASLFNIIAHTSHQDETQLKIKLTEAVTLNQAIHHLLDKIQITQIKEIIPSIHDIFIEKVSQSSVTHA
ncbi:ABC transporter ATP-binding protein [Sphingobacterium yanglingense]|uniref:ABC-2 type transport system ATP-binding protein n=1 Tax=Sphingobacterium yanglingense TaxID=1437280 RepID=A0A4R6WKC3_9SPHI|nr:ABC transporter ATP-binding protein [Sphingobacterium yanglingense]TDQ79377.1 ABC-2 type transport system ATP-binding protein [Sphingobacterium yanglingense]